MTKREAVKEFKMLYEDLYTNHVDYWTAEQHWSYYTDALCKEGKITQKQYSNWKTPFRHGKHI